MVQIRLGHRLDWTLYNRFAFSPLQWLIQQLVGRPECWPAMQKVFRYTPGNDFPKTGKDIYLKQNAKVRELAAPKGKNGFLEFNLKQG